VVGRSSFSSVGSLFHVGGAATEKALSPIHPPSQNETQKVATFSYITSRHPDGDRMPQRLSSEHARSPTGRLPVITAGPEAAENVKLAAVSGRRTTTPIVRRL